MNSDKLLVQLETAVQSIQPSSTISHVQLVKVGGKVMLAHVDATDNYKTFQVNKEDSRRIGFPNELQYFCSCWHSVPM